MKKIIYIGIGLLLLLYSCKKKPDYWIPSFGLLSPELAKLKFLPGTTWIFSDSVKNMITSINVTDATDVFHGIPKSSDKYESYAIYTNDGLSYTIAKGCIKNSKDVIIYWENSYIRENEKIYDSLFIYDRYYKNVKSMQCNSDPAYSNNKTIYYLNADYGFLRLDIYNSSNTLISKRVLKDKTILR